MALPVNLSFVTVMDVAVVDRRVLNGGTFEFEHATTLEHRLPFQNDVTLSTDWTSKFTNGLVDGVTATITVADDLITLNPTSAYDVLFDLPTGLIKGESVSATITATGGTIAATDIHVGLTSGDYITITGSTANDGTYIVDTVGTDTMTVVGDLISDATTETMNILTAQEFQFDFTEITLAQLITELEAASGTTKIKKGAFLDTLTISNISQEGPRKEIRGGKNAQPVVRYGKTARLEIEDAVFNLESLYYFADVYLVGGIESRTEFSAVETYPKAVSIIGDTYIIDKATGDRSNVYVAFPQLLPDGLFNINMESEGDIGVMSIAGELFADDNGDFFIIKEKS